MGTSEEFRVFKEKEDDRNVVLRPTVNGKSDELPSDLFGELLIDRETQAVPPLHPSNDKVTNLLVGQLLEQARKSMLDEGRHCLIVPLEQCGDDWRGWALNMREQDVRVIYTEISGLRIEKGEAIDESDL